jgi:hypothetical protein
VNNVFIYCCITQFTFCVRVVDSAYVTLKRISKDDTIPRSTVMGGMMIFPIDMARQIRPKLIEFINDDTRWSRDGMCYQFYLRDEVTSAAYYIVSPNHVSLSLKTAQEQVNNLKEHIGIKPTVDITRPMPYIDLQRQNEEHQAPCNVCTRSAFLVDINDEVVDIFIDAMINLPAENNESLILIPQFNGRVNDLTTTDTAFPHRAAKYWLEIVAKGDSIHNMVYAQKWANELHDKILPYSLGSYINGVELNKSPNEASNFASNLKRLRAIKYRYDPENVFHNNRNITPAAAEEVAESQLESAVMSAAKSVQQGTGIGQGNSEGSLYLDCDIHYKR